MEEAEKFLKKMLASGLSPDVVLYSSLIRSFITIGTTIKVISLLHHMAAKSIVLDLHIASTILKYLCFGKDSDILESLPTFSTKHFNGRAFLCQDLLKKLQTVHPDVHLSRRSMLYNHLNASIESPGYLFLAVTWLVLNTKLFLSTDRLVIFTRLMLFL